MTTTKRTDCVVTKTLSLPIGVLEKVMDEADLMGCGLSQATTKLLIIALAVRKDQRMRDEEQAKDQMKRIKEAAREV